MNRTARSAALIVAIILTCLPTGEMMDDDDIWDGCYAVGVSGLGGPDCNPKEWSPPKRYWFDTRDDWKCLANGQEVWRVFCDAPTHP